MSQLEVELIAVCCDGKSCHTFLRVGVRLAVPPSHVSLFRNLFVKLNVMEPASSISDMHFPRVHVCMYAERKVPVAHLINIYLSCELVILEKCSSTCP